MNDQFTNGDREEELAQKLNEIAEQTHASAQFAAELEGRLRHARQSKANSLAVALKGISPALRWAALMILLALALSWSIRTLIPAPRPGTENTPVPSGSATPTMENITPAVTPSPETSGYDFRGAKLHLEGSLPQSPGTAHVYSIHQELTPATAEQARVLADRFGIQGEMYTTQGLIHGTTNYLISDGKQSLQVHSDQYFTYSADMAKSRRGYLPPNEANAEDIITEFLTARGFDFPFRVSPSESSWGYSVQPLAPDSTPLQFESFSPPLMRVVLDESGQVLSVDASLIGYDPNALGEYGIITAEEALQKLLDDSTPAGKMEYVHSARNGPQEWYRDYPDNQPLTIYGYVSSLTAADSNQPPLILMDGVPLTGNTTGMESLEDFSYIKVTGQFYVEDIIRKFDVASWDRKVQEMYLSGTLSRQRDQIIFTSDDGSGTQYVLADPPADVPLDTKIPDTQLGISGVVVDGNIVWTYIQFFAESQGGGGGGSNGLGFYRLNLSGTPVPFPSPTPRPEMSRKDIIYVIKEGDTVFAIAEAFGITPEEIVEANPWLREENVLTPGRELNIPGPLGSNEYIVQENDTLTSIALNHGVSVEALMQANGITENIVFLGQRLIIPSAQGANNPLPGFYTVKEGDTCGSIAAQFGVSLQSIIDQNQLSADCLIFVGQQLIITAATPVEQNVTDLRGYLSIGLHQKADGTSFKEYGLEVVEENGSRLYTMEGPQLAELDAHNGLPILVTGTIDALGKLVMESYKIPYPDLHFQILKGTQRAEQVAGQNVLLFTTEDGKSYVEFLVTNPFPLDSGSFTGQLGDLLQQEVLIIPDETFGGMPVAHLYQSSIIQEGAPEMQVQANRIPVYNETNDPNLSPEFTPPNLTIDTVELAYYVSNPYYQVNDPNYGQRPPYLQPAWRFHGRYDDGSEFEMLVQALRQEHLLPELAPGITPG